jgi:RecB family exonuclease
MEVHRRIELHNRGQVPFEEVADELYDAVAASDPADLPDAVAPAGPPPFEVFMESTYAERRPRFIETPIDLKIGQGRLRGRIDAIYEPQPGFWEIVDYKSGSRRDDPSLQVQLQAYAVAAAQGTVSARPPERIAVSFLYLGGGKLAEDRTDTDGAWLAEADEHLNGLMEMVLGDEFPTTPSAGCQRCDFLRFCEVGQAFVA